MPDPAMTTEDEQQRGMLYTSLRLLREAAYQHVKRNGCEAGAVDLRKSCEHAHEVLGEEERLKPHRREGGTRA